MCAYCKLQQSQCPGLLKVEQTDLCDNVLELKLCAGLLAKPNMWHFIERHINNYRYEKYSRRIGCIIFYFNEELELIPQGAAVVRYL
jgi:hypothetical protein